MDNWTLEDVGELLSEGPNGEKASELHLTDDGERYFYKDVSWDVVAFECLAQTLSNIVLTDVCYVDSDNSGSWIGRYDCLSILSDKEVVRTRSFGQNRDLWVPTRELIAEALLTCPEMRATHEENKKAFSEDRELPDEMLSQVIHGGAGMMARARLSEMTYVAHPQRERLIQHGAFMLHPSSAGQRFNQVLHSTRMNLYQRADAKGLFAQLNLPPVAIQIINEANGTDDLLITALQMRDRFKPLREWLTELQHELEGDDAPAVLSKLKLLTELGQSLEVRPIDQLLGSSTLQMGVADLAPKVTLKVGLINSIRNRFGVRSQITKLLLTEPGLKAVRRFCGFFQKRHSEYAIRLELDLQRRWAQ